MIHKKMLNIFLKMQKKQKNHATKELTTGERIAIVAKTIAYDIGQHQN